MQVEEVGKGIVKRRERRVLGLFIDGTGLDRATRRLNRRVDMSALIRGVTSGAEPEVARYYTLIPFEDDSRHRAFLDAVTRAGLNVCVKRLPPKGVNRQVAVDVEMAADIIAFALGQKVGLSTEHIGLPQQDHSTRSHHVIPPGGVRHVDMPESAREERQEAPVVKSELVSTDQPIKRIITIVCPSRELVYPISLARELGVDTVSADFGHFSHDDMMKSAAKWIDLSDSETIWMG